MNQKGLDVMLCRDNNRPARGLECAWCGSTDDLHMTKFLVVDEIICGDCLNSRTDEELGIEEWDNETFK